MTTTYHSPIDPRIKRTRQLLLQAFIDLVEERHNLHSISVQEVAQKATVNRATFYAHFENKFALLESWLQFKFHRIFIDQFSVASTLELSNLSRLIRSVVGLLAQYNSYLKPADKQYDQLFEYVLQQELYDLLLNWVKRVPSDDPGPMPSREAALEEETTAQVLSWAILGPAMQWSRGSRTVSEEELSQRLLRVVSRRFVLNS